MLKWSKLLNPTRRKTLHGISGSMNTGAGREEIERDYDRILFSAPTRRLADKTQVFPMEENDAIRNRLTHSHEVSNLARSIGIQIAFNSADEVFGTGHEELKVKRTVPALLATVGLAHDLGNPPFGHQGEVAIQKWFIDSKDKIKSHHDLLEFDGNPQTFRLLTRLQVLNDKFGFNLTVATLSALLKYPTFQSSKGGNGYKKFGIFESEREIAKEIWKETGLEEGLRHPLAYIMEACDDIAYSVIDAEDTIKKGYASFYDLIDLLEDSSHGDCVINETVKQSRRKNEEYKGASLSSRELNEISMQMFRTKAISMMVVAATETFVANVNGMLNGKLPEAFDLIGHSRSAALCRALKEFDKRYGFLHSEVLQLELEGNNYIKGVMDLLWDSLAKDQGERDAYERYAYGRISENYRRVYESSAMKPEDTQRLLCDFISGMTEKFLIRTYQELRDLKYGPK